MEWAIRSIEIRRADTASSRLIGEEGVNDVAVGLWWGETGPPYLSFAGSSRVLISLNFGVHPILLVALVKILLPAEVRYAVLP